MEPEIPSPYPQVPPTCPYPEPTPSTPHDPLQLPEDPSLLILKQLVIGKVQEGGNLTM
jgi:hypothetical protein